MARPVRHSAAAARSIQQRARCIDAPAARLYRSGERDCRYRASLCLVALRRFPPVTPHPHRYRALAGALAAALRAGRYPPGTRLPSVRQLCAEHGASLATVTHALHELEDAGLIEARARRGFFARAQAAPALPRPAPVGALELEGRRKRLMELAATRSGCLSLGHLALPAELLPLAALRRLLARQLQAEPALLATGYVFGSEALREQLARRAPRLGCGFGAEDIVVTAGEGESLELCLRLLARPGDLIAVASPAPLRALELIASLGLQALELPAADGGLNAATLEQALEEHPGIAACVIESAGSRVNGAGAEGEDELRALAALLARRQLPLIECDMMGELYRGALRPRPLKAFDAEDWVLYCGSFACITGPGFSLGHVVSGRHRLRLRAARAVHGELLPALTDRVLAEFMAGEGFDRHLRRLRQRLKVQVADHAAAIAAQFPAGTRVSAGTGGYALWVALPAGRDALALLERARERGYTFVPGAVFGLDGRYDHCLRLTAGHPLDAARAAGLRILGELARDGA